MTKNTSKVNEIQIKWPSLGKVGVSKTAWAVFPRAGGTACGKKFPANCQNLHKKTLGSLKSIFSTLLAKNSSSEPYKNPSWILLNLNINPSLYYSVVQNRLKNTEISLLFQYFSREDEFWKIISIVFSWFGEVYPHILVKSELWQKVSIFYYNMFCL